MIVAHVRFVLPTPMSLAEATARFETSAPKYVATPGLLRKHYLRSDDGRTVGGIYLWASRAAAEACYAGEWRDRVAALYGVAPIVDWYESPVGVDTATGTVFRDETATEAAL